MNKQALRQHYLQKRRELSPATVLDWSAQITSRLIDRLAVLTPKRVHCFLPITANKECNTIPLIKKLWDKKIDVVVPVSNFETKKMEAALLTESTATVVRNGITEPAVPLIVEDQTIDIVIVPLAIADQKGFRIGYGGGFYDRFIAKNPQLITIGVSFFDPIVNIEPTPYDQPVNEVITPNACYSFN